MTSMNDEQPALADLAVSYAESGDPGDLARLRQAIRTSPGFDPGLDVAGAVAPLFARDAHQEVVTLVHGLMPGAFFGPSAHAALGAAYEGLGDTTRAQRERRTQALALDSILSTGDGTRNQPWSVLRVSDEYDVLRSQERSSREQASVVDGGRSLDRHECDDASQAWFDVTGVIAGGALA